MKPWIVLIVLSVALTAAATVAVPLLSSDSLKKDIAYPAPAKRDGPAPVVQVVEDLVYNFGSLPQHYKGKHTWTFKNTGAGPLELRGASKTCSCTTATLFGEKDEKQITIAAGESLPIDVTFDTKNWNNDKWSQNVTVGTNDPSQPTVTLRIEGVVKPAIITTPLDPSISYGPVGSDDEITRLVFLHSLDRPDLKLTKLVSSNPALIQVSSRLVTTDEGKRLQVEKAFAVEVTLKPSSNLGAFAEEVLIETDHPQMADLRFKVTGKVTGPITFVPERITVRNTTSRKGGMETIKILARNRTSVNFTVEKKPQGLDLSIEPVSQTGLSKGSMYKMTVNVLPGTESGRIVDEVVLKTDDPKASEVKVPVDVLVQGAK